MIPPDTPRDARTDTRECLARIETHDSDLHALITTDADSAMTAAQSADAATRDGRWQGLLHGMTMLVKDNIDTGGLRTTCGSRFFADRVPNRDAPVVARLRGAGAVILGKTSLHELAFGVRSNNPVVGQTRNPWDPTRIPGGSSGGSGVAVAMDFCTGALGTDTGGSVRLPASINGVSGLRPTVGRVPNTGSMAVCPTQDTIGPMARAVADVARIFCVIAGVDGGDPLSEDRALENFLPRLGDGVAGVRIGVPGNHYFDDVDAGVAEAVMDAVRALEARGARLVDVPVADAAGIHEQATTIIYADACAVHAQRLRDAPETFDTQVLARMRTGLDYTAVDYANALRARERWKRSLAEMFQQVDVLCSPTMHTRVPPIEDGQSLLAATRDATRNTYLGAFGQLPGLSVPCGVDADGLPVGLQIEGPWWSEPLLLRVGHTYQTETNWHLRRPPRLTGTASAP